MLIWNSFITQFCPIEGALTLFLQDSWVRKAAFWRYLLLKTDAEFVQTVCKSPTFVQNFFPMLKLTFVLKNPEWNQFLFHSEFSAEMDEGLFL